MAVTQVKPLRKVEADAGTDSMEVTVDYRVTCDSLNDGPQTVLGKFPLGRIVDGYIKGGHATPSTKNPPQVLMYPWPEQWCSDITKYWTAENGMGIQAKVALFISNVRIVEREKIDRQNGTVNWIVEVTFSRDQEHGADYSIREITPYYLYEDQPQEYGAFLGLYKRVVTTKKPSDGPSQPGQWAKLNEPFYIDETVFKGYVSEEDADEWRPLALCNTVGTPLEPGSLVQRVARPAFKCEWFSYTALDFSDAVGKVNASPYTLVSWDSGWKWPTNSFAGEGADHPAVIFYRCFNPRELLVHTVDCEIVNWSGRRCYKYSVDLIYDRDGHDKYIANIGSDGSAKVGSDTVSGGTVQDEDVQEGMSPTQLLKGVDGSGPSRDVFINYDGTPLVK